MVAVVGELLAGLEPGFLADDPLPLDHQLVTELVGDHPFSRPELDGAVAVVADGEVINVRERTLQLRRQFRVVLQAVEHDAQPAQLDRLRLVVLCPVV